MYRHREPHVQASQKTQPNVMIGKPSYVGPPCPHGIYRSVTGTTSRTHPSVIVEQREAEVADLY
jgi:hypothetical protein